MNTVVSWNPIKELDDFSTRLSSLFGRLPVQKESGNDHFTRAQWAPAVDIAESDKEYLITAELADVNKADVKVTVDNGELVITGERKMASEDKTTKYHRIERAYGSFLRSFILPEDADAKKIRAEFKNGLLNVHLPKSEATQPKQIDIKVD